MTTAICKHGIDRIRERCHQCDTSMPKFALPKTPIGFAVNFLEDMAASGTWHGPTLKRAIEVISQIPDALPSTPPARDDVAALVPFVRRISQAFDKVLKCSECKNGHPFHNVSFSVTYAEAQEFAQSIARARKDG